jgi:hypothetical protein
MPGNHAPQAVPNLQAIGRGEGLRAECQQVSGNRLELVPGETSEMFDEVVPAPTIGADVSE